MNDSDFERLKNAITEFTNNIASVLKVLGQDFEKACGSSEEFANIMKLYSKKSRHRRSYYRMMERRAK